MGDKKQTGTQGSIKEPRKDPNLKIDAKGYHADIPEGMVSKIGRFILAALVIMYGHDWIHAISGIWSCA